MTETDAALTAVWSLLVTVYFEAPPTLSLNSLHQQTSSTRRYFDEYKLEAAWHFLQVLQRI